jgi:glucokinase
MRTIVTADIGGTHARFALAEIADGAVVSLGEVTTLRTADHASFQLAWQDFGRRVGSDLPNELAVAFAGPVDGDVLKLTNNPWVIRPALIRQRLGVDCYTIVNDFGAVAHAVATLGDEHFRHLCGPGRPLPDEGVTSIVGPGTGLGVAALLRTGDGYEVIETEGGHIDFAPLDVLEDRILVELRRSFRPCRSRSACSASHRCRNRACRCRRGHHPSRPRPNRRHHCLLRRYHHHRSNQCLRNRLV